VLVNLSNHPLKEWQKEQESQARRLYGTLRDLPFPLIDPQADGREVAALAHEYALLCRATLLAGAEERNAVHLMGEQSFVFAVASVLLDMGIECLASTSERLAVEHNGLKISQFNFVRFRPYVAAGAPHAAPTISGNVPET